MGTHEKTWRGFMTLYRSITGSSKPNHAPRSEVPVVPAEYVSRPQVYGRRSFDGREGLEKTGEERCPMVEGRKSVSCLETTDLETVASFLQVKVMECDMPGFMQVHAFRCARRSYDSLEKFSSKSKYIALTIKKEFEKVYGPAWHCIVGSDFSSFVTHATGCFLYFSMDKLYILLFKTNVLAKALFLAHGEAHEGLKHTRTNRRSLGRAQIAKSKPIMGCERRKTNEPSASQGDSKALGEP